MSDAAHASPRAAECSVHFSASPSYEAISASGRFEGWRVAFTHGGAHAGAGSWVDFVHGNVAAQLCAWPSGCIDTCTMRIPEDPEPVFGHVEVDSEEAIAAHARAFEERVLALLGG